MTLSIYNLKIPSNDLQKIIDNIHILNLVELKHICNIFNISYNIYIIKNGIEYKTSETDHKEIIINNILSKNPQKTLYNETIINYNKLINLSKDNIIYYGQYKTTDKKILNLLKSLTDNKFKFGAISQKIIRYIWKDNKLITYNEFANLWVNEYNKGINYKELAYNQFMKKHGDKNKWFEYKNNIIKLYKKYNLL